MSLIEVHIVYFLSGCCSLKLPLDFFIYITSSWFKNARLQAFLHICLLVKSNDADVKEKLSSIDEESNCKVYILPIN